MAYFTSQADHLARRRRASLLGLVLSWVALRRQRIQLAELQPHILDDIGVTEAEARSEASRAFWDAPHHWYQ